MADIEKNRAYLRKHYAANKQYYIDKAAIKQKELRQYVRDIKSASACLDCNIKYPYYVMDFDHRDADLKLGLVNKLTNYGSLKKIQEEIAKCDLVCSNCHRIRTYKRKNNIAL